MKATDCSTRVRWRRRLSATAPPAAACSPGRTSYRVEHRRPLQHRYRGRRVLTNPPPSSGGLLIAFAQELLAAHELTPLGFGSPEHLGLLVRVMEQTNLARSREPLTPDLLGPERVDRYRRAVAGHPVTARGTTHISVLDARGNAASLSLSNGEGSGYLVPGAGIMLNNMLGEEDLNPDGFHAWPADTRVSSMMAPSLVVAQDPEQAVASPRVHFERGLASIEPGFPEAAVRALQQACPRHHLWNGHNLFFGGTHVVAMQGERCSGAGDPRRGGVYLDA